MVLRVNVLTQVLNVKKKNAKEIDLKTYQPVGFLQVKKLHVCRHFTLNRKGNVNFFKFRFILTKLTLTNWKQMISYCFHRLLCGEGGKQIKVFLRGLQIDTIAPNHFH